MYCVRKVTDDIYWVGANEHRLHLFEISNPTSKEAFPTTHTFS